MLAKMPTGTPGVKRIARMLPLRISPSIRAFTDRQSAAADAEEQTASDLQHPSDRKQWTAAPIGEATERDRGEERHERKRRGNEADGARPGAEREQPVRRNGPRHVHRCLRSGQRRERVCEPPSQAGSSARIESASLGMCTLMRSPGTRCPLCTVSGSVPTWTSYS